MAHRAPGKHFRTGISLAGIMRIFPDDRTAEDWFIENRWHGRIMCPRCGSGNIQERSTHPTMRHRCRSCKRFFSVKTGTVMQASNLGYRTWAIAIYLLTTSLKSVSSMKMHRDLGVTQKTAWHLAHRIREAYGESHPALFAGPVEVDETYVGGKERNKHEAMKLRAGRGSVGKTAIVGMKDRDSNRIAAAVVENVKKPTLQGFVAENAAGNAAIYTDENLAYEGLPNHASVKHGAGEYVSGAVHTNGLESFWAMFKRAQQGTFHKMSRKHLQRYVSEFSGRHNSRGEDTLDQMMDIAEAMIGKRLTCRHLVEGGQLNCIQDRKPEMSAKS